MALPVMRTLDRIEEVTGKIAATLPVIRSTADSISTAINGHATPDGSQNPAQVQALVPRNVGGMSADVAKGGITGAMILGFLALLAVFYVVKRR